MNEPQPVLLHWEIPELFSVPLGATNISVKNPWLIGKVDVMVISIILCKPLSGDPVQSNPLQF